MDFWNAVEQKRAIPQIWHNEEHWYKIFYTRSEKQAKKFPFGVWACVAFPKVLWFDKINTVAAVSSLDSSFLQLTIIE